MSPAGERTLDVWLARPLELDGEGRAAIVAAGLAMLSAAEQAALSRLRFEVHRHEQRVAAVLRRTVLAHALGTRPEALAFEIGPHGKPALSPPSPVHFNVSHAAELVVCAVHDEPVGVDTEALARGPEIVEIATTVFVPEEIAAMEALPPAEKHRRAVALWTLKEAYLKARGVGLLVDPRHVAVRFRPLGMRLELAPEAGDDGAAWSLELREVHAHLVALAFPASGRPPRVVLHDWTPPSGGRGKHGP